MRGGHFCNVGIFVWYFDVIKHAFSFREYFISSQVEVSLCYILVCVHIARNSWKKLPSCMNCMFLHLAADFMHIQLQVSSILYSAVAQQSTFYTHTIHCLPVFVFKYLFFGFVKTFPKQSVSKQNSCLGIQALHMYGQ